MELYKEILINILEKENVSVEFKNCEINSAEIVNLACYRALYDIKDILQDSSLTDKECFSKIEQIIVLFESIGSGGGDRHDF